MTNVKRRTFMKSMAAIGTSMAIMNTGLLHSSKVLAAQSADDAFEAKSVKDALIGLYGHDKIEESGKISLKVPEIAENGAVVPVTVTTDLANVESIAILAEKNATPLVATFDLSPRAVGHVATRIKMGQTANVIAVVKADGKLFSTRSEVKVTIGGCGG